ncbi:MAG: CRISPR-associated protein Cmr4 [Petrotoga sp.]|jgi:CRISPR-associated protein Cmr4|nr:CRISPR-associated protein Cmr4 [Petrotoga sp.]
MNENIDKENVKDLEPKTFYMRALDPLHIGAGGYRLGRVDNTIVRDPATDIPKIPGTAIAGVIREFTILHKMENDDECKNKTTEKEKRTCAEEKVKSYFGTGESKGMLRFYDGQIIFFPVSSILGTVWITTKELLEYWFIELNDNNGNTITIPDNNYDEAYALKGIRQNEINLGWLFVEVTDVTKGKEIKLPLEKNDLLKRIVIVSEKLFSHIVNDNLEIRTSVRIDPTTGTAAEGALFTYEAIPRGTILGFEVVKDNTREKDNIDIEIEDIFPYFKLLGIGGMGTRGFGRIELLNINKGKKKLGGK